MKKWWIGYTGKDGGVMKVDVATETNVGTGWERSHFRLPSGVLEDAPSKDLFATEAEAKRGRIEAEAENLEDEASAADDEAEEYAEQAREALANVKALTAEAAALRARAKALRDSVDAEVKDATEGRR